jgi:hypothetical protein
MSNLQTALVSTRDYFSTRQFNDWLELLDNAIELEKINDHSFVEPLWCKFGDTCEVDDLIITEYNIADEDAINSLNSELCELTNILFAELDKLVQNET